MAQFSVSTEELRSASTQLTQAAGQLEAEIDAMGRRITDMRSMWTGDSSNAFDGKWREWEQSSKQLKMALEDISSFLTTAASGYEEAERGAKFA